MAKVHLTKKEAEALGIFTPKSKKTKRRSVNPEKARRKELIRQEKERLKYHKLLLKQAEKRRKEASREAARELRESIARRKKEEAEKKRKAKKWFGMDRKWHKPKFRGRWYQL